MSWLDDVVGNERTFYPGWDWEDEIFGWAMPDWDDREAYMQWSLATYRQIKEELGLPWKDFWESGSTAPSD